MELENKLDEKDRLLTESRILLAHALARIINNRLNVIHNDRILLSSDWASCTGPCNVCADRRFMDRLNEFLDKLDSRT